MNALSTTQIQGLPITGNPYKAYLESLFILGIHQCHPRIALKERLPNSAPRGRNIILAAGKAAFEMAEVALHHLQGPVVGAAVTRYGYGGYKNLGSIKSFKAGHPIPDDASNEAAEYFLNLAQSATEDDRILFLISGGGSSLLSSPIEGITPQEKKVIIEKLILSGAQIRDINHVRKSLSRIKGGQLAGAASNTLSYTYLISDVVGDDPQDIASGPSIFTKSDPSKSLRILNKYNIPISKDVVSAIQNNDRPPLQNSTRVHTVAKNSDALDIITRQLTMDGWKPILLGNNLEGEACLVGRNHAKKINALCAQPGQYALISGGELTVSVNNKMGRGGPNLEYLAGLLLALDTKHCVSALAADSDGVDGSQDNAGGFISHSSLDGIQKRGINIRDFLQSNTTYDLFEELDDLLITGPTGTNVNDIRIILVESK